VASGEWPEKILRLARRGGLAQDGHPSPDVQLSVLSIKKNAEEGERRCKVQKCRRADNVNFGVGVNRGLRGSAGYSSQLPLFPLLPLLSLTSLRIIPHPPVFLRKVGENKGVTGRNSWM